MGVCHDHTKFDGGDFLGDVLAGQLEASAAITGNRENVYANLVMSGPMEHCFSKNPVKRRKNGCVWRSGRTSSTTSPM